MAKYINLEDAITELRKSHSIGEAHRRLLQMESINITKCKDCKHDFYCNYSICVKGESFCSKGEDKTNVSR